jgi:hypothetical protein
MTLDRHQSFEIEFLGEKLTVKEREIGRWGNAEAEKVIVLIGGIHGNESAGIFAIERAFHDLSQALQSDDVFVLGLIGNLSACKLNQRFVYRDLNRLWSRENIDHMHYGKLDLRHSEFREMTELYDALKPYLLHRKEVVVIDLHTTSSPTHPFTIATAASAGFELISGFNLPAITGLSGFLDGTLLDYINQLGHLGFAFEGGQHAEHQSVEKHHAFIMFALHQTKAIALSEREQAFYTSILCDEGLGLCGKVFNIVSRYRIDKHEQFRMKEGFYNFRNIEAGEELAISDGQSVSAPYNGRIFMPLYQQQGEDGFFIVKELGEIDP